MSIKFYCALCTQELPQNDGLPKVAHPDYRETSETCSGVAEIDPIALLETAKKKLNAVNKKIQDAHKALQRAQSHRDNQHLRLRKVRDLEKQYVDEEQEESEELVEYVNKLKLKRLEVENAIFDANAQLQDQKDQVASYSDDRIRPKKIYEEAKLKANKFSSIRQSVAAKEAKRLAEVERQRQLEIYLAGCREIIERHDTLLYKNFGVMSETAKLSITTEEFEELQSHNFRFRCKWCGQENFEILSENPGTYSISDHKTYLGIPCVNSGRSLRGGDYAFIRYAMFRGQHVPYLSEYALEVKDGEELLLSSEAENMKRRGVSMKDHATWSPPPNE